MFGRTAKLHTQFKRCLVVTVLFALTLLLTACANATPAATARPTTPAPTLGLQTLPPTWTPTTPFTPIPTRTAAPTRTIAPTLSVEAMCSKFQLITKPEPDIEIPMTDQAIFAWKSIPDGVAMRLYIHAKGSKAGLFVEMPYSGDGLLPYPVNKLPDARHFEWSMWLEHPQHGTICIQRGKFLRKLILSF